MDLSYRLKRFKVFFSKDLNMSNITDILAGIYGNRVAVYLDENLEYGSFGYDKLTYKDISVLVNSVANFLLCNFDVKKGERIILYKSNDVEFLCIMLAVMKIGAIAVPVNDLIVLSELKYMIGDCCARILITDNHVFKNNIIKQSNIPDIDHWIVSGITNSDQVSDYTSKGFFVLDNMIGNAGKKLSSAKIEMHDPVAIFYTSGTTGSPKGAIMTSRNLLGSQKITALILPFKKSDLGLTALPQSHIMGFASSLIALLSGLHGYFLNTFNAKKVLNIIGQKKITIFIGVPAMYSMMLNRKLDNYDLSSIRIWFSSADTMSASNVKKLTESGAFVRFCRKKIIGSLFINTYGMVELSGAAVISVNFSGLRYSEGLIGYPLPFVKVKLIDCKGDNVPKGEAGELLIRGSGVTPGYFKNIEASKNLFMDGWLRTGDIVKRGKVGQLYFVDREKDVIKSGGYSVFSAEVEEIILNHPQIASCAVIGIPASIGGNQPLAVITLKKGALLSKYDIYLWCKENIASYKCPRDIKIILEDQMPYGPTMKILKRELKERFKNEFSFKWMKLLVSE